MESQELEAQPTETQEPILGGDEGSVDGEVRDHTDFVSEISPQRKVLAFIWETVRVTLISLAIIIPVRYYLVQPFFVNGASMEETFHDGDYILIDEISYRFHEPKRGDIVVFRFPGDPKQFFIKRIIGMPGEAVEITNNQIFIYNSQHPTGHKLDEKEYLSPAQRTTNDQKKVLASDEYFVMGDNRLRSSDSRSWGSLPRENITGRVFYRAWPFTKFGPFEQPTFDGKLVVQANLTSLQ